MIRTQIQIEEEAMEWLRMTAARRRVSISQLFREGIAFYRDHHERLSPEKKEKALSVVGKFSSGTTETAKKHDDFLVITYSTEKNHDE